MTWTPWLPPFKAAAQERPSTLAEGGLACSLGASTRCPIFQQRRQQRLVPAKEALGIMEMRMEGLSENAVTADESTVSARE